MAGFSPHSVDQLAPPAPPDPSVQRVLAMFKCHFDAGFIDTQAAVVHKYFTVYFPRAIQIAVSHRSPRTRASPRVAM